MNRILIIFLMPLAFLSCNSLKRLDKLAVKHGKEITETIRIDTVLKIPGISFDASYFKKYAISELHGQSDTTRFILRDGTKLLLVDQYSTENRSGIPEKIGIKRKAFVYRNDKEVHILKSKQYKRISIAPPDKLDVFLSNMKWISISLLSIAMVVWFVRKLIL